MKPGGSLMHKEGPGQPFWLGQGVNSGSFPEPLRRTVFAKLNSSRLSTFGATKSRLERVTAVRREYAHLSSLAWCWGRSRFLSQLARADSPPIFATPAFRAHGESAARRNAAEESASLWRQLLVLAGAGFVGVLAVLAVCIAPGALPSLLRRGGKTWLPYSHIANS